MPRWKVWTALKMIFLPRLFLSPYRPPLVCRMDVLGMNVLFAGARMKLYGLLDKLQDRALYCDTDSCLYVTSPDPSANLPLGDYLGLFISPYRALHHIL